MLYITCRRDERAPQVRASVNGMLAFRAAASLSSDVQCLLIRCTPKLLSSQAHITDEHGIVGGYTPVTKQLWAERLKWTPTALEQAVAMQASTPKQAKRISVSYPFTTDRGLKEVVCTPPCVVRH
jgi:hypothetical protein